MSAVQKALGSHSLSLSLSLLSRSRSLRTQPHTTWDGSYEMTTKSRRIDIRSDEHKTCSVLKIERRVRPHRYALFALLSEAMSFGGQREGVMIIFKLGLCACHISSCVFRCVCLCV